MIYQLRVEHDPVSHVVRFSVSTDGRSVYALSVPCSGDGTLDEVSVPHLMRAFRSIFPKDR